MSTTTTGSTPNDSAPRGAGSEQGSAAALPAPRRGRLQRMLASLGQSKADQHARDLQTSVRDVGATPICDCTPGQPASVTGVLRSVTLRPREGVPAVEAELFDGSGSILLVWLGRRRIRGVEPGRSIVVHGRITCTLERPAIFNPRYELRPVVGP